MTETTSVRATLHAKGQLTLPKAIREALDAGEGDQIEFVVTAAGDVVVRGFRSIPSDQAWFWTPEWLDGEYEASYEVRHGLLTGPMDGEEFLKTLSQT